MEKYRFSFHRNSPSWNSIFSPCTIIFFSSANPILNANKIIMLQYYIAGWGDREAKLPLGRKWQGRKWGDWNMKKLTYNHIICLRKIMTCGLNWIYLLELSHLSRNKLHQAHCQASYQNTRSTTSQNIFPLIYHVQSIQPLPQSGYSYTWQRACTQDCYFFKKKALKYILFTVFFISILSLFILLHWNYPSLRDNNNHH